MLLSGTNPVRSASRRIKGQKEKVLVHQPAQIGSYNAHMGGVDILDGYLANLRPCIGGKKWYWMPLINIIRLLQVAAYRSYVSLDHPQTSQLEFVRHIVAETVTRLQTRSATRTGQRSSLIIPRGLTDEHVPVPAESQGRCVACSTNTRMKCSICEVRVHEKFQCFLKMHNA